MFIVLFFLTLLLISLIGSQIQKKKSGRSYINDSWQGCIGCSCILLALCLFILFIAQMDDIAEIQYFKATKQSVERARNNPVSEFELATMQNEIIEMNGWLFRAQYFQRNLFTSWFVPRSVKYLQPIE